MAYGDGDLLVDLEGGGTVTNGTTMSEDKESIDSMSNCRRGRMALNRVCNRSLSCNESVNDESDTDSGDDLSKMSNVVTDKCSGCSETRGIVALVEKKNHGESRKKCNLKKSSKPPRPPKGPILNASDLKLVKELSEIAARKRARLERMKALRKMKETKRPTSSASLTALLITILFCIVIIFQGVFSGRNARKELLESPAPATTKKGLISIQLFNNAPYPTNEMNQPSSLSMNIMEQQPWSSSPEGEGRDAAG